MGAGDGGSKAKARRQICAVSNRWYRFEPNACYPPPPQNFNILLFHFLLKIITITLVADGPRTLLQPITRNGRSRMSSCLPVGIIIPPYQACSARSRLLFEMKFAERESRDSGKVRTSLIHRPCSCAGRFRHAPSLSPILVSLALAPWPTQSLHDSPLPVSYSHSPVVDMHLPSGVMRRRGGG